MNGLDALPHGILGLKSGLEEKSSTLPLGLIAALVLAAIVAAYIGFRRTRKKKIDRLQHIRQELDTLSMDERFSETFSSVLKEGLLLRFGLDLTSKGAKDIAPSMTAFAVEESPLAMPKAPDAKVALPFKAHDLEMLFQKLEQELYAEIPLTTSEKQGFREQAKEWLREARK